MNVTSTQQYVAIYFTGDDPDFNGVTTMKLEEYQKIDPKELDAKLSSVYSTWVDARTPKPVDKQQEIDSLAVQIDQLTSLKAELEASLG